MHYPTVGNAYLRPSLCSGEVARSPTVEKSRGSGGSGTLAATNRAAMDNQKDPLNSYIVGMTAMEETAHLQAEADRLKKAAEAAEKKVKEHNKQARDLVRAQARRAQFVGELFLAACVENPVSWANFRPRLMTALGKADDELRALFGLEPKQIIDAEQTDKKEASEAVGNPVQQPA